MSTHQPLRYFRIVAILAALAMFLAPIASHSSVAAQSAAPQIVSPEVTYTGTGPTGYEVTFRYYDGNPATTNVKIRGEWYFSTAAGTTITTSQGLLPSQWVPGAFPIAYPNSGAAANWPIHPMTQDPETLIWSFTTPMPSGTYTYGYLRNCTNADFGSSAGCATSTQIADPGNPPWNTSGSVEPNSQVYVPSDPAFMTPDMSWQAPNPVPGTLVDVTYPSPQSTNPVGYHYLAVYLPPGYDPNRSVPYPTLYLSHGGGGNEVDWSTQGVANRIIDNLIAAGKVQPMVVAMTNANGLPGGNAGYRTDVISNVIPYVEANYNVSHNASDRAFAGLSMGGSRANDILFNATTTFGYVASWSIGSGGAPVITSPLWQNPDLKTRLGIQIGGGRFDRITVPGIDTYEANLTANGIPFVDDRMDGGHAWYVWRQMLYDFASTMAFKHTTTSLTEVAAPGSSEQRRVVFVTATVKASTTEPAWPTGKVQFYLDGQQLDPARPLLPDGTAKQALPQLSPGPHTVTAVYSGDNFYNTSTSESLTVTR
jgi:enterochelin esterase-like enzyme